MALDPGGTLLVSVPRAGRVLALPDDDRNGRAEALLPVVEGLDLPHGLAFLDGQLYIAETGRVLRFDYDPTARKVRGGPTIVVPDLPPRGSHWTRTIAFGPDRRLYVAVGSSCNNCEERDGRRAAVYRYRPDGSGGTLRHGPAQRGRAGLPPRHQRAVGDRERARLAGRGSSRRVHRTGAEGGFYGWPYCHWAAAELVLDPDLGGGDRCRTVQRPSVLYQAHAARSAWSSTRAPSSRRTIGAASVALHGSWNRSVRWGTRSSGCASTVPRP